MILKANYYHRAPKAKRNLNLNIFCPSYRILSSTLSSFWHQDPFLAPPATDQKYCSAHVRRMCCNCCESSCSRCIIIGHSSLLGEFHVLVTTCASISKLTYSRQLYHLADARRALPGLFAPPLPALPPPLVLPFILPTEKPFMSALLVASPDFAKRFFPP